jgi:hypothetical protein
MKITKPLKIELFTKAINALTLSGIGFPPRLDGSVFQYTAKLPNRRD